MGVRFDRSIEIKRGKNAEATAFASEICTYYEELTGVPLIWGLEIGGTVGKIHWYSDYESLAAVEVTLGATMADEGWAKLLDTSVDLFVGQGQDTLVYTM